MQTPYFTIHEPLLDENIQAFLTGLDEVWDNSRLAYSVKTNSLPWILKKMRSKSVMAEVVSDEEYDLALQCGYDDADIIFNGPIKGERFLRRALQHGAIVNLDSKADIELAKRHATKDSLIGIRLNVPVSCFDPEDVEYTTEGFRFGFAEHGDGLESVLRELGGVAHAKLGLHLHCNSVTRSLGVYRAIARFAAQIIEEHGLDIAFIDIGGGFFGGVEGKPSPSEYLSVIKGELEGAVDPEKVMLLLEPGSALIGSTTDLHTSVLDVKDTDRARIVTTDGSRLHIDPLWKKSRYTNSIESASTQSVPRQVICGYTCMDHDRLMILDDAPELMIGDQIVYHRVGAYSMTLGGMFIRYYPDVYVENGFGEIEKVRSRISTDEYIRINS